MSRAQNRALRYSAAGDRGWRPVGDPAPPSGPDTALSDGDLRRGWALADIDRAAATATRLDSRMAGSPHERYELAWSAAAEHLFSAAGPVSLHDLIGAALGAMTATAQSNMSCHGVSQRAHHGGGSGSAPRFAAYWCAVPAEPVVDRIDDILALVQIWPRLSLAERAAIAALAAFGDHMAAADALGLAHGTFRRHLAEARRRFLRLWHEGEVPSGLWASDRPSLRKTRARGAA